MQLNQIFKMEFINAGLEAKNKDEVLAELVNVIIEGG
jgi:mannitol/fructose-specific phosphotransferase system IIA component (Ntr-type)